MDSKLAVNLYWNRAVTLTAPTIAEGSKPSVNLLLADAKQRPELFRWNGPVDPVWLQRWLDRLGLCIPQDLFQFYVGTGGGDFFESETILGPSGDKRLGDDLLTVNSIRRGEGMDERLLLFHSGVTWTAIDRTSQQYVRIDQRSLPEASYASFNEWYYSIRKDFAQTYGLTKLAIV